MAFKDFIDTKKREIKELKRIMPLSKLKKRMTHNSRNFLQPFDKGFIVIAEIKKASPSEGSIAKDIDIVQIAKQYEKAGAGIISVLTDRDFFCGDVAYLPKVKSAVSLPILRKDFIIDEYQIYESKAYGADAVLLIAKALSRKKLEEFVDLIHKLDMECLVEIHNERELKKISNIKNIKVIGVNNRDLDTLKTDLSVIENLIDKLPKDKIIISESGIKDKESATKIRNLGVNGILTGTSLMKSKNKRLAIKELLAGATKNKDIL